MVLSESFDQICCGTIILSVPLVDDVVQIGARDAPHRAALRICKRRCAVFVERTDGKPLQVGIVHHDDATTGALVSLVFRQPVRFLKLRRRRGGWEAALAEVGLTDLGHLKQFLDTIGVFGTAKQASWVGADSRPG